MKFISKEIFLHKFLPDFDFIVLFIMNLGFGALSRSRNKGFT